MIDETNYVRIDSKDNVIVSLEDLKKGQRICMQGSSIEVKEEIPMYHKMAICDIHSHSPVFKYGEKIGVTVKDIFAGEHVHVHNLKSGDENVF